MEKRFKAKSITFGGITPFKAVWDNTDGQDNSDTAIADTTDTTSDVGSEKNITQDQLNSILAKEKKKEQDKYNRFMEEIDSLKTKSKLKGDDATAFEEKYENLKNEFMTKEQLALKNQEKTKKRFETEIQRLTEERDTAVKNFSESTINRSIIDAAVANKAVRPEQIVAMIRNNTHLVQDLDEDGTPNGKHVAKVKFADVDKDGNPITLDLTTSEAVKRMTEMDEHYNLFEVEGVSGMGLKTRGKTGSDDPMSYLKDQDTFNKARKEGKLKF